MNAYSMGRFQRVVGTDGRFSGTWVVHIARGRYRAFVRPHDVVVYGETRHSGRVLGPDSFIAWVDSDGTVDLPEHMIRASIRDDVLDAMDDLLTLLPLIVAAAEPSDLRRSTHQVYRVIQGEYDDAPCFCDARADHIIGKEQTHEPGDLS